MSCSTCRNNKININIVNSLLNNKTFLTEAVVSGVNFSVNRQSIDSILKPKIDACFMEMATETAKTINNLKKSDYASDKTYQTQISKIAEKYVNDIIENGDLKNLFSSAVTQSGQIDKSGTEQQQLAKANSLASSISDSILSVIGYIQFVFGAFIPSSAIQAADSAVRITKLQKIKRSTKEETPPAIPLPNVGPGQTDIQEIKIRVLKYLKEDEERTSSRYFKGPASSEISRTYQDLARWFKNHTPKDSIDEDVVDYIKMILSPYYEKKYGFQAINTSIDNTNYRIAPDMNPEIYSGIDAGKLVHQGAWQIYINPKNDKWFPERTRPKPNYNPFNLNNPEVSKTVDNIGHTVLDILGVFDPTGIADGLNFLWYMNEYQNADSEKEEDRLLFQAATSLLGAVIPYVGDISKITNITARIKIAFPLVKRIRSIISPKSVKLNKFFDSLENLFNNPKKIEKLLAGTEITAEEIIKKSFLEITSEIIKASMKAPFEFIKNIPLSTKEAELIRKAYLNTAFTQSIIYNVLNSKKGIEFMTFLLSIPFDFAKEICQVIYSEKDIHNTLQTLAQDKMFAEKAEGKTILSKFRNVAVPYFEEIEDSIVEKSKNLQSLNEKINENKIKISIINKDLLNEGANKEAVETVIQTIMRRSIDIEAVIKSVDDILPSIIKTLDSKSLLRILEKIKIRIKLTEADLSSIKSGIVQRETKINQLTIEEKTISDKLFDLNRKTVKTSEENVQINDFTTKIQAKQREISSAKEELTRLKAQTEPKIKEKEAELKKLKEKETELNNKQREIEQEPSKWNKLKDRVAGVPIKPTKIRSVASWAMWSVSWYTVSNLICRQLAFVVAAWIAAKKSFISPIADWFETITGKIINFASPGLIAWGAAQLRLIKGGLISIIRWISYKIAAGYGCASGTRIRFGVAAAEIINKSGLTESMDTITQRLAEATDASPEEIEEALYGDFKEGTWFKTTIDAMPFPKIYGDYGKVGNIILSKTDPMTAYQKANELISFAISGASDVNKKELQNFAATELKDKFFVSAITASQMILIRKYLISKGIKDPELQTVFLSCLIENMMSNLVNNLKDQKYDEILKNISSVFHLVDSGLDITGISAAALKDKTAFSNRIKEELKDLNEKITKYMEDKKINIPGSENFGNTNNGTGRIDEFLKSAENYIDKLNEKGFDIEKGKKELENKFKKTENVLNTRINYYKNEYLANTEEEKRYKENNIAYYTNLKNKNEQIYKRIINVDIINNNQLNTEKSSIKKYDCETIKKDYSAIWQEAARMVDISKGVNIEVGDIVTYIATGSRMRVVAVDPSGQTITVATTKGNKEYNKFLFMISQKK